MDLLENASDPALTNVIIEHENRRRAEDFIFQRDEAPPHYVLFNNW